MPEERAERCCSATSGQIGQIAVDRGCGNRSNDGGAGVDCTGHFVGNRRPPVAAPEIGRCQPSAFAAPEFGRFGQPAAFAEPRSMGAGSLEPNWECFGCSFSRERYELGK